MEEAKCSILELGSPRAPYHKFLNIENALEVKKTSSHVLIKAHQQVKNINSMLELNVLVSVLIISRTLSLIHLVHAAEPRLLYAALLL